MSEKKELKLQVLSELDDSLYVIGSPGVGYYVDWPLPGTILTGGAFIGRMKILNSYYNLFLPEDVYGRVKVNENRDFAFPVEYGEELFCLNPERSFEKSGEKTAGSVSENVDISEGGFIVKAFTMGIFYAKSSPDSPPFVKEGQEIEKGKALGLIEVMKTFNHIIFSGTNESDTGIVKKILVKDGEEVKLGQALFLIK